MAVPLDESDAEGSITYIAAMTELVWTDGWVVSDVWQGAITGHLDRQERYISLLDKDRLNSLYVKHFLGHPPRPVRLGPRGGRLKLLYLLYADRLWYTILYNQVKYTIYIDYAELFKLLHLLYRPLVSHRYVYLSQVPYIFHTIDR